MIIGKSITASVKGLDAIIKVTSFPGAIININEEEVTKYTHTFSASETEYEFKVKCTSNTYTVINTLNQKTATVTMTTPKYVSVELAYVIAGDKPSVEVVEAAYTGSVITNGYTPPTGIIKSGTDSAINPPGGVASYTPSLGYKWSDGTTSTCRIALDITYQWRKYKVASVTRGNQKTLIKTLTGSDFVTMLPPGGTWGSSFITVFPSSTSMILLPTEKRYKLEFSSHSSSGYNLEYVDKDEIAVITSSDSVTSPYYTDYLMIVTGSSDARAAASLTGSIRYQSGEEVVATTYYFEIISATKGDYLNISKSYDNINAYPTNGSDMWGKYYYEATWAV